MLTSLLPLTSLCLSPRALRIVTLIRPLLSNVLDKHFIKIGSRVLIPRNSPIILYLLYQL